ncbi:MAG: pilus assembly protein N-terminal domain-containing protein, partial [Candidatus Omnitrophica bacterium]|nr:pilus assembly protein N-terminal domain-containing protein [Candidatus Omnitrophota bacterium]
MAVLLFGLWVPVANAQFEGYRQMAEYACEIGMQYLGRGNLEEARHQFEISLLAQPGYEPALYYLKRIDEIAGAVSTQPRVPSRDLLITGSLDNIEKSLSLREQAPFSKTPAAASARAPLSAPALPPPEAVSSVPSQPISPKGEPLKKFLPAEPSLPEFIAELFLDSASLEGLQQPLELELGYSVMLRGTGIRRFLVTAPGIVTVEKISAQQVKVTADRLGYTYLHLWDDEGRKTLEMLIVPRRPQVPTLAEEIRGEEERAGSFKLRYSLNWRLFEEGRRLRDLKRQSYSWHHSLNLDGETPYGRLDAGLSSNRLNKDTDLNYFTVGLTRGSIGRFKGFSIRAFDFDPGVSNLLYGGGSLRGFLFKSPVADNKLDYTIFRGEEGGGIYPGLSPGIVSDRDSELTGVNVRLHMRPRELYEISAFESRGRDRSERVNDYGYDFHTRRSFGKWAYDYDLGFDSQTLAQRFQHTVTIPDLRFSTEFRDIPKKFSTMTGLPSQSGELGVLFSSQWRPTDKLRLSSRLDMYRDRLFPNESNRERWNQDFQTTASLQIDPLTSLNADYGILNNLGRVSPFRSYNFGAGFFRTLEWRKKVHTYLTYRFFDNENFSAGSLDYSSHKLLGGFRFDLIRDVYFFFDQEFGWVDARSAGQSASPYAYQVGLDWSRQYFDIPLYSNVRLSFRDEEDTESEFSFLSGEDALEGFAQLSYRPRDDFEIFFNTRMRNIWAENPEAKERFDMDFFIGLRYTWDTGVRWDAVGGIEGYVFKDENADGI